MATAWELLDAAGTGTTAWDKLVSISNGTTAWQRLVDASSIPEPNTAWDHLNNLGGQVLGAFIPVFRSRRR